MKKSKRARQSIEIQPQPALLDQTEDLTVAEWERIKKFATIIEAEDGPFLLVSTDDHFAVMYRATAGMDHDGEIKVDLDQVEV